MIWYEPPEKTKPGEDLVQRHRPTASIASPAAPMCCAETVLAESFRSTT